MSFGSSALLQADINIFDRPRFSRYERQLKQGDSTQERRAVTLTCVDQAHVTVQGRRYPAIRNNYIVKRTNSQ